MSDVIRQLLDLQGEVHAGSLEEPSLHAVDAALEHLRQAVAQFQQSRPPLKGKYALWAEREAEQAAASHERHEALRLAALARDDQIRAADEARRAEVEAKRNARGAP